MVVPLSLSLDTKPSHDADPSCYKIPGKYSEALKARMKSFIIMLIMIINGSNVDG